MPVTSDHLSIGGARGGANNYFRWHGRGFLPARVEPTVDNFVGSDLDAASQRVGVQCFNFLYCRKLKPIYTCDLVILSRLTVEPAGSVHFCVHIQFPKKLLLTAFGREDLFGPKMERLH